MWTTRGARRWRWAAAPLIAAAVAVAAFAGGAAGGPSAPQAPEKLTIAYQPGIGYAPLIIIKRQRWIEKRWPGTKVEWKELANGSVITQGIISGDIEMGAMGVGPFLTGWARGVGWKMLTALDDADLWLMVRDRSIRTLGDLRGKKIATPTSTSIQAVVLRRAAQMRLGDARALDSTLVSLDHPDGLAALFGGQIHGHFTSPPFQFQEKERGARVLLRSSTYFGKHTFLGLVVTQKFYDANTAFAKGFYQEIQRAMTMLKKKPGQAAGILSREYGGKTTAYGYRRYITNKGITYTTTPRALMKFARFMKEINAIPKEPKNWKEITFPTLHKLKGS